jgi:hypothetical protein
MKKSTEQKLIKFIPPYMKKLGKFIHGKLPPRLARWTMENKIAAIIIAYSIVGLMRPSMWAVYIAIFAYFQIR